jgi:hypothetical protein
MPQYSSSLVKDRKMELAQTCRIGSCHDRGDLAMPDRELEDAEQLPVGAQVLISLRSSRLRICSVVGSGPVAGSSPGGDDADPSPLGVVQKRSSSRIAE